jgi:hypothetical protein
LDRQEFARAARLREARRQRRTFRQLALQRQYIQVHGITRVLAGSAPPASSSHYWSEGLTT